MIRTSFPRYFPRSTFSGRGLMQWVVLSLVAVLCFALSTEAATTERLFPRPAGLEPAVKFWTRVYTEIDTGQGFLHDPHHLDVVYATIDLPTGLSRRARNNAIVSIKKKYAQILHLLATRKHSDLRGEAKRVLTLWPDGVSRRTLRDAASRIRFQKGQADRFQTGWVRSGRWMPYILQTLSEHGLPRELAVLPHVESSFDPSAFSHAGAAGLWQFTRSTGRRFLRVNTVLDERMDPYLSTIAAAQLLEQNHATLGHWPLALTAYNHGVAGMRRAVRRLKTYDIETIVKHYRSRTFGFASRNFYAAFLAAMDVDHNVARYFGNLKRDRPIDTVTLTMPYYLHVKTVEAVLGVDRATLKAYNPALQGSVWSGRKYIPRNFQVRLPSAMVTTRARVALTKIPKNQRFVKQPRDRHYHVRRGDTLSGIAARYGVRVAELTSLNRLRGKHLIYPGQRLVLPTRHVLGTRHASVTRETIPANGEYVVRRGDSIYRIAQRFGVDEQHILSMNGIRNRHHLDIGQVLRLRPHPRSERQKDNARLDENVPATAQVTLSADPSDYTVARDQTIEVQALETLGHYAEWLGIRTQTLRTMNDMDFKTHVVSGTRLRLDFSRVSKEVFESRRLAYHQALQETFFRQFRISGTHIHTLQHGESIWALAKKTYQVPVWLLRQYNPDLDLDRVGSGVQVSIPVLERVTETTGQQRIG